MNQDIEKGTKPLQEEFKKIVTSVPKEDTQKSSTKPPHLKYGPHVGIKFDFNRKTKLVVKPFSFDSRTKSETGSTAPAARNIPEKQTNKKEINSQGDRVERCMENLKISNALEKANIKSTASGNVLDSSTVLSQNEDANLCNDVVKSLDVIKPVLQSKKVTRSMLPTPVKPHRKSQASNALKPPSSTVVEPVKYAKPQTTTVEKDTKISHKKYNIYSGLKLDITANGKKKNTIVQPFNFEKRSISTTK